MILIQAGAEAQQELHSERCAEREDGETTRSAEQQGRATADGLPLQGMAVQHQGPPSTSSSHE